MCGWYIWTQVWLGEKCSFLIFLQFYLISFLSPIWLSQGDVISVWSGCPPSNHPTFHLQSVWLCHPCPTCGTLGRRAGGTRAGLLLRDPTIISACWVSPVLLLPKFKESYLVWRKSFPAFHLIFQICGLCLEPGIWDPIAKNITLLFTFCSFALPWSTEDTQPSCLVGRKHRDTRGNVWVVCFPSCM